MQMEEKSTREKQYPIDVTKKWGVTIELDLSHDNAEKEDTALLRGWLERIDTFPEFNNILTMRVNFVNARYGSNTDINKILELEENVHVYPCYFPLYHATNTVDELEKMLVNNSQGWLKNFKLKMFTTKTEQMKWSMKKDLTYD